MKYFVVSDVHSYFKELMDALHEKGFDADDPTHKLIVCGDLFDRGDETVKLFEFIKELHAQDRLIYVKGNHEILLKECVKDFRCWRLPSYHHFGNGTVKTICQFCGQSEWIVYDSSWYDKICEVMQPVLDFIDENCVNYYETENHIFCHGWIPPFSYLHDFRDADNSEWEEAMWLNGMNMWLSPACRVEDKTIVCGHFHTSWGHARIHHSCSEWDEDAIFDPFVDDGIIAIDACTAYSQQVNCIVIED